MKLRLYTIASQAAQYQAAVLAPNYQAAIDTWRAQMNAPVWRALGPGKTDPDLVQVSNLDVLVWGPGEDLDEAPAKGPCLTLVNDDGRAS